MPFELPSWDELLYRAWRLRRLIAVANALPFVIFALLGLVGLNSVTDSVGGLLALTLVHFIIISAHALLFPNAAEETVTIAVLLAAFGIIMAIAPALIGLVLCLALAAWALIWGQAKLLEFQTSTETHDPETSARIKTKAKPEAARAFFPLRPNSTRGQFTCGAVDKTGAFPVWSELAGMDATQPVPQQEDEVLDKVMSKLGSTGFDPVEPEPVDQSQMTEEPSFWARIEIDEPEFQRTRLFFRDASGQEEESSCVEHRFKTRKSGVIVRETDMTLNYPMGLTAGMWLSDFQMDGLVYLRELLENSQRKSLRAAHRWSLLTLAGQWFALRQMGRADAA